MLEVYKKYVYEGPDANMLKHGDLIHELRYADNDYSKDSIVEYDGKFYKIIKIMLGNGFEINSIPIGYKTYCILEEINNKAEDSSLSCPSNG